jgi:hypothetical protein
MSLTPIGAVALLFAIYAFLWRPHWTFFGAIFFMGFSACAFVNIGGAFGLSLSVFLFLCYGLVLIIGSDGGLRISLSRSQVAPLCLTLLLGLAMLVSLCRPALKGEVLPISISVSVFSAVGLGLTWLTVAFVRSTDRILDLLRVAFASVVFISCWGALQLACALLHIPYPSSIFNNSASHFALQYGAEASSGHVRVGSVGVEPSLLLQSIGIPCSIAATLLTFGVSELRKFSLVTVVSGAFTALISTSTTGYAGALVLLGLLFAQRPARILVIAPFAFLLLIGIVAAVPNLAGAIAETSVTKSHSWSYEHRLDSILDGFAAFKAHPIVGIGAGALTARSLPIHLLANVGLVGAAIFSLLIVNLAAGVLSARAQLRIRAHSKGEKDARLLRAVCLGVLNAFAVSLVMQIAAGPTYAFPDFWVLMGLMIALCRAPVAAQAPRASTRPLQSSAALHVDGRRVD